ncbi:MAG TPA: phage tail assembly chaperone [Methylophilus sp.]|uniref:phage tail assembly chaperone n=1 Tax=Methylophilus sp. TaxID=29541 RepID=UPI002BB41678|nr:phage tail assembly chaperone [Methylophilus sp.]HSH86892.1 phage tail assembly chaperone [Methylophilus sp.]
MAKIKLDLAPPPETIKHTITLLLSNDDEADLEIEYIYRDGQQMVEYANATQEKGEKKVAKSKASKVDAVEETPAKINYVENRKNRLKEDVAAVMEIAKGWEFEDEFNAANLIKFENKYPGALLAISTGYFTALQGVRLKN